MKKTLYLVLFLFASTTLFGQLNYGIKGGVASSTQDWIFVYGFAKNSSITPQKGTTIGIFAEYSQDKYLGVIAEVNYIQKGGKIILDYTGRDTTGQTIIPKNYDYKLSYFNISLMGKLRYDMKFFSPYAIAGLKTEYQLNNDFSDDDLGYLKDETAHQLWGWIIGAGFEIKDLLPITFIGEIRYVSDFNKIFYSSKMQITNNTVEIRFGIKI